MTSKRTGSTGKGRAEKLTVKKETLKDLEARDAKGVKGGTLMATMVGCRAHTVIQGACGQKTY
ncbi:MAG TPA: hypothetical protein VF376_10835 [Thermoanaerobaculia bacterium]